MDTIEIAEDDRAVKHFELLLTEKELADSLISGFGDLNLKVLAFFGAGIVLLSWLYSDKAPAKMPSYQSGVVSLLLVAISCAVILQGLSNYGRVLTYIEYKNDYLNVEFARLLKLTRPPFQAVLRWSRSPGHAPITAASALLLVMHLAASVALLVYAACCLGRSAITVVAVVATWFVLVTTFGIELLVLRAARRIFSQLT